MNPNAKTLAFFLGLLLLIPSICVADGGGPILLIINGLVFLMGQVWILISEYSYLYFLFKKLSLPKIKIFKATVVMNVLSTLIGAILFPLALAVVTFPGTLYSKSRWGGLLMASGSWVAGDSSPFKQVAIGAAIVGFVITYFLTVWIEYRYLDKWFRRHEIVVPGNFLKHCFMLNGVSYLGLIILFFGFIYFQ